MSKRYVFWRDPKGKPHTKDFDRYAPHELLAEFGKETTVNADGNLTWSGFTIHKLKLGLKLSVVVDGGGDDELNDTDSWRIVQDALYDAVRKVGGRQPLRSKPVLELADVKAQVFFGTPVKRYAVVTGLSVAQLPAKRITIGGCVIEPLGSRTKYPYPSNRTFTSNREIQKHLDASSQNQLVRISTSGRTISEAFEKALRALNLLRSLWTLSASFGSWSINIGGAMKKPIGSIQTSLVHTIHETGGKPVEDVYWYEREAVDSQKLFNPIFGWDPIEKFYQSAATKIQRSKLRSETIEVLCRYVVALDQVNHEIGFLQLWGTLEKLTDTVGGGSGGYDETVRRASWLFRDRTLATDLLEAARVRRNQYVHSSKSSEEPDQTSYLLKMFVEQHLVHLINNPFKAQSFEQYARSFTLSTDTKTLKREINARESVAKFLKDK